MQLLAGWFLTLTGTLIGRLMLGAGLTFVTYGGLGAAATDLVGYVTSAFSGDSIVAAGFQLAAIAGVFDAMAIIVGAFVSIFALCSARNFSLALTKSGCVD